MPTNRGQYGRRGTPPKKKTTSPKPPKVTPGLIITQGSTSGMTTSPPYEDTVSALPQESDLIEANTPISVAHAAAPNTMRLVTVLGLDAYASITDEITRMFDRFKLRIHIDMGAGTYTRMAHLAFIKGPNGMTFSDSNANPSSGAKAAFEAALANGSEIKYLPDVIIHPYRDGAGNLRCERAIELDIADKLNAYTAETEIALAQGRSAGKYVLGIALSGVASQTTTCYVSVAYAFHTRQRKLRT